ncbi:MAG: GeoRSP system PqqD family peptide chaperone [Deltaproteobacteria bacterium]|nr:GeoRSP system PqqD family peptide chaperone [Deltaproteobacteria bacterium]
MTRVFRNPDVLWRRESENCEGCNQEETVAAILFSGGTMLSLNEFGIELWELCDGRTVDELVASLMLEFDVDEELLRTDIQDFLQNLSQKGFVRYE